ncbi:MAG TPA: hypothetical protein VJC03_03915 [bacterium]|nr:hypothetical protein [bacterium]
MNKSVPEKIIRELKEAAGENLISLFMYESNRLAAVLKELDLEMLFGLSGLVRKMAAKKIITLFLTESRILSSCDVYPLEYIRMKRNYILLAGRDIIKDLQIPEENVRLESEQKIKGTLIRLTQIILEEGKKRRVIARAAFLALEDLLSGLEGLLYLRGKTDSVNRADIIPLSEKEFSLDLSVLKEVESWKAGAKPGNPALLLHDFYEKIEELAETADRFKLPS